MAQIQTLAHVHFEFEQVGHDHVAAAILAVTVASAAQFQQNTIPGDTSGSAPSVSHCKQTYAATTLTTAIPPP
jgi:hypothetical protein